MKHAILFPCYKPDHRLNELIDSLKDQNNLIIILIDNGNDNSYHNYFKLLSKKSNCVVFRINENNGKGNGIKKGINFLYQNYISIEYVIFADSDGQHTYNDIIKFINVCNNVQNNFFLIGRRRHNLRTPFKNRFGNLIYNFLINRKYKLGLKDTLCGLRAIHFAKIDILRNLNTDEFDFEIETLLKIKNEKNIHFKEVEISSTYFSDRKSNFLPIIDSIKLIHYLYKKTK